jgi:hypothetical protein
MTKRLAYVPTAYAGSYLDKWWIFLRTPSGTVVRLQSYYVTREGAEHAIERLGFKLIERPMLTLTRANTTPR